ncbi:MAG: hypothetical protein M5U30_18880 [Burkholderiaceae bacterium]|nr:hypothetical protein [Burkholderiaceae bacterium]
MKYVYPEHLRGTVFPGHESIVMYRDTERMAAELARFSASDARTFRQLVEDYGEFVESAYLPLMYSPPLPPSVQSAQLEKSAEGRALLQWQASTPVQLLNELFESEEVKVHFLARMTVLGFAPDQFGQGWICLFRIIRAEAPICVGAPGSSRSACVARWRRTAASCGPTRPSGASPGARQPGRRGGARRRHADRGDEGVVTNVEPKKTFLHMVGEEHLPASFATRVRNYHSNGRSLFVLHLALAEPPDYRAAARNPAVNTAFSQRCSAAASRACARTVKSPWAGRRAPKCCR